MAILKQDLLYRTNNIYGNQERQFSSTTIRLTDLKNQKVLEIRTYTPSGQGIISRAGNILSLLSLVTVGKIRWLFTLLPLASRLLKRR